MKNYEDEVETFIQCNINEARFANNTAAHGPRTRQLYSTGGSVELTLTGRNSHLRVPREHIRWRSPELQEFADYPAALAAKPKVQPVSPLVVRPATFGRSAPVHIRHLPELDPMVAWPPTNQEGSHWQKMQKTP